MFQVSSKMMNFELFAIKQSVESEKKLMMRIFPPPREEIKGSHKIDLYRKLLSNGITLKCAEMENEKFGQWNLFSPEVLVDRKKEY